MASTWGGSWGTSWGDSWGAADAGEHNLTPTSVQSASQVSAPSLGQIHVLTATGAQSTSSVTAPALGQIHALAGTSVESDSEVSSPVLEVSSAHDLVATSVQSLSQVTSPALGQIHALTALNVRSLSELSLPALNGDELPTKLGGDDVPRESPHRGYDPKRARLKIDEDARLMASIRAVYRDITGAESPVASQAADIVAAVVGEPAADTPHARVAALGDRLRDIRTLSVDSEIALRMLHAELRELQERDDEDAIQMILAQML